MFSFSQLSRCALSVALTAGIAVDVAASEFTRERAASAMYGKTPAEQRMMLSERAAVMAAPPGFRMPPPHFASRAEHPVRPMPPGMPVRARAPRQFGAPARFQRPLPPSAFNPRAMHRHPAARVAQYRQPMPPPAPVWARAARPPVALARFQRPLPPPAFNPRATTRHPAARIAQYRQPMPPPAPMWARAPRPPVALARFQRPVPPAFNPRPTRHAAARLAQYRQPMPAPVPMWARAPRQLMASPSFPADTQNLQAQKADSKDKDLGQASETAAELAAFESSPPDTIELQAENVEGDNMGQASESTKVEAPVAEVPPLLARPTWMKRVTDGS